MDRRQALSKLAASGVVIGATSAIRTLPAFAAGGAPVPAGTPTLTVQTLYRQTVQPYAAGVIVATVPKAQCGASAVETRMTYDWVGGENSNARLAAPPPSGQTAALTASNYTSQLANGGDVTVTFTGSTAQARLGWLMVGDNSNTQFWARLRVRFTCVYPSGATTSVCASYAWGRPGGGFIEVRNLNSTTPIISVPAVTVGTECPVAP